MAQPTSITLETPVFDQDRAEAAVRELLLAVGEDPDALVLQDLFFGLEDEEGSEAPGRGLTIEEMVRIAVPPYRPPW